MSSLHIHEIDPSLMREIRVRAAQADKTVKEFVLEILITHLRRKPEEHVPTRSHPAGK